LRLGVCLAVFVSYLTHYASAQFTDPRTYTITAVGTNQLELGYAYVRGNASVDPSLVVPAARLTLNQGAVTYTRYFGVSHRLTWAEVSIPVAGLSGSIGGTRIQGSTTGASDSSYSIAMLLKGGPALDVTQLETYEAVTTVGASFTVTAPTGSYDPNVLLNLGTDRWSFKSEIGLSYPFGPDGRWEFDAHANAYFYTDNLSYHRREILRQEPLPGIEGHISYSFLDNLWASLDTRYSLHAATSVDGIDQNNAQRNFILGSELNLALSAHHSVVLEFAKALAHRNGPALTGFSVRYDFTWESHRK